MEYQVIIVGCGPIGLMVANLLGQLKIKTLVIEKEISRPQVSKAIGITPPSLQILNKINLDEQFISLGVKINTVVVHGSYKIISTVKFNELPGQYPFILSIPQYNSETILEQNLTNYPDVEIIKGERFSQVLEINNKVLVDTVNSQNDSKQTYSASYICACDGGKSDVRKALQIPFIGKRYHDTFLMADYYDETDLNNEVHLFFTKAGSVESFPLPEKKRRWVIQTPAFMKEVPNHYFEDEIYKRSLIKLNPEKRISISPFGVQHFINKTYSKQNRIFFCGDAAHTMSPIGGQGMNTGFADADFLAVLINQLLHTTKKVNVLSRSYEKYRKIAALSATKRAWISMRIGTIKGAIKSGIRNSIIKLLLSTPLKKRVPSFFSMLTIPYGSLLKVKRKIKKGLL